MITNMKPQHIKKVAFLHFTCLDKSFLSSLGLPFLIALYKSMLFSKESFTFVYEDKKEVFGFITGCTDTSVFFKELIRKRWFSLLLPASIRLLKKFTLLVKIITAIIYPSQFSSKNLSKAELLSIAVDEKYREKQIGTQLLNVLNEEFKNRGIASFKVGVKKNMLRANNFYKNNDFIFIETFNVLGDEMNFYEFKSNNN